MKSGSSSPATALPSARRKALLLAALAGVTTLSALAITGSVNGWFTVGAQVVRSRVSRDAINQIPLPLPLRDGSTASTLPRFHTYLGSPEQAAVFFRQQLPLLGFDLEREWASTANARFQIWHRGDARVYIALQAPFSGPAQPTRIGLSITPFAQPPVLP